MLTSKLPNVGTTIFTVMSKMAAEHNAINLSQGYPDFSVPEILLQRMEYYLRSGFNQYPPMAGVAYLRAQIAVKSLNCYGVTVDPEDEITVTSGATEALFVAVQAVVSQGDEVIVLDPCYDAYEPAINLAGARAIHVPLQAGNFKVDWQQVAQAITPKTRLIMINSPHNPSGAVFTRSDLDELAQLTRDAPIFIIADEVYEHMVFDGRQHESLISHAELREKTFVVSSFGKTYHATGWKVGYCIAPAALTTEFRKIHQFVTFTTHTPTQWALADFLEHHPEHHNGLSAFYQQKRDFFLTAMAGSGFVLAPSAGTYFQLADYSAISAAGDTEFATWLTQEIGVAAIPVSVFYQKPPLSKLVRFCFAKEDETLHKAATLLKEIG